MRERGTSRDVIFIIIFIIAILVFLGGCTPPPMVETYTDQPLTSESSPDTPIYIRIHMDKFVDQKGALITRFIDPDNGNICYFRGEGLVCFKGE